MMARGLLAGVALLAAVAGAAAETPAVSVITVTGSAGADLPPDLAVLTLGVTADRPTAVAATADLATAAAQVLARVKAEGVAPEDVATAALSLTAIDPNEEARSGSAPRRAPFYRAATTFHVKIRSVERAGAVASRLIDAGANAVQGLAYEASQADQRLYGLRGEAALDARRKAQLYVEALGLHLGRVLEIMPDGGARPMMMAAPPVMKMAGGAALPTAPGTLHIETGVTVRWEVLP